MEKSMIISLFAYSKKGCETADRVRRCFEEDQIAAWCPARLLEAEEGLNERYEPIPKLFRPFYGERFAGSDALIFVGACGIAVREIAPFVKSKKTDPAVLCVDDHGRFVIPVLSGHIGGANELAVNLAGQLNAVPVVTTATDINGKFAVDAWAARNGYAIDNMKAAKDVSALILEQDIPIYSEFPVEGAYPPGTYAWSEEDRSPIGIYIGWEKKKPFAQTLRLIPKALILGIGCRKNTPKEAVKEAIDQVLADHNIDKRSIAGAASIDIKAEEAGLLEYAQENGLEIRFYSAEELKEVNGDFSASEFVKSITGVDNVCERAALADADTLIVKKTAKNGVTVAIAQKNRTISF